MGRRKIAIAKIENERTRQATFTKRKRGLLKKAMEIAILCDCGVALTLFDKNGHMVQFSSSDMETITRLMHMASAGPVSRRRVERLSLGDYERLFPEPAVTSGKEGGQEMGREIYKAQ